MVRPGGTYKERRDIKFFRSIEEEATRLRRRLQRGGRRRRGRRRRWRRLRDLVGREILLP